MFRFPKSSIIKTIRVTDNSPNYSSDKDKYDEQNLSSVMSNLQLNATSPYRLAGEVWRRIELINCVSVRACPEVTLGMNTKIYMKAENNDLVEIGKIDEIYGHVNEPLYEIIVSEDFAWDSLGADNMVYYDPSHPCTKFVHVRSS